MQEKSAVNTLHFGKPREEKRVLKSYDPNGNVEVEVKEDGEILVYGNHVATIPKLAKALKKFNIHGDL